MQRQRQRRFLKAVAIGILMLVSSSSYSESIDESAERYQLNVEAQNIEQALRTLANASGKQLLFPYDQMEALKIISISGRYTLEEALDIILKDTSLSGELTEEGVILVTLSQKKSERGREMKSKKNVLAAVIGFFVGAGGVQHAVGQEVSQAEEQWLLEEVVVTATKRKTSLQDTSMSISVLSGEDLEGGGAFSLSSIMSTVPGADLANAQPGFPGYIFRGVASQNSIGALGNEVTSTYLDEIPLTSVASDIGLVDISRVEVLKGPQGTLYGKSAMGGVVRYISNEPAIGEFSGGVNTYGSNITDGGTNYGGSGYLNFPITENLAARVVAYNFDNDGFIDADGADKEKNVNTSKTTGGRIALKWDIGEATSLSLTYLNQKVEVGTVQSVTSTYTPTSETACPCVAPPDFNGPSLSELTRQYAGEGWDFDTEIISLKLDKGFEKFNFSVIAAQSDLTLFRRAVVNNFVNVTSAGRFFTNDEITGVVDTVEVRLVSAEDDDALFDWVVGFWYEDSEVSERVVTTDEDLTVTLFGLIDFVDGSLVENWLSRDISSEKALYGEVGLHLTDKATFTLGYRRSDVERDDGSFEFATGIFDSFANASLVGLEGTEVQEDVNTYKVKYEYALDNDILLYALAASGYRAGGFNANSLIALSSSYESDTLWNYELGVKTSWLENHLTANGVIYRIDWDDMQLNAQDPDTFVSGVRNVGRAKVQGLELEFNYLVTDGLSFGLNYSFTDATLEEDFLPVVDSLPQAHKGDRLPGSSRHTYALFADWQRPITTDLDFVFRATHRYIGDRVNDLGDDSSKHLPSYEITDLEAGVDYANGVTISLFADNIFNKIATVSRFKEGNYMLSENINRPRTVGLNVGYNF